MLDYKDIVNMSPAKMQEKHQAAVDKATFTHTIEVERRIWRELPATQDFLQKVKVRIEELQQSAEGYALSGDSAKCQIATIQATTLRNILSNYA